MATIRALLRFLIKLNFNYFGTKSADNYWEMDASAQSKNKSIDLQLESKTF